MPMWGGRSRRILSPTGSRPQSIRSNERGNSGLAPRDRCLSPQEKCSELANPIICKRGRHLQASVE